MPTDCGDKSPGDASEAISFFARPSKVLTKTETPQLYVTRPDVMLNKYIFDTYEAIEFLMNLTPEIAHRRMINSNIKNGFIVDYFYRE